MEWLSSFAGSSGIPLLVFLGIVLLIAAIAVKKGKLSFKGHGLEIGAGDQERQIIRQQMQYINTVLDGTIADIPVRLKEGLHYYRTKYIISKVKDIYEETIIYNHITDDDEYIHLKQEIVYNTVLKLTDDDYFKKPQFKEYLYKLVEENIKRLVVIRKHYSNK